MPDNLSIDGDVAAGFEAVRVAFESNFAEREEKGASCCVYVDGGRKVDLWGGVADVQTGKRWEADTLALVYSATKGATSVLCHRLAAEGQLDLDAPVADYWPEFGAAGKGHVTVRTVMAHRAGLPLVEAADPLSREELLDGDAVVRTLAAQTPLWEPGSAYGYHALTFGWLLGEVVARVTGKSLGAAFQEQVAVPLGLDFFIGLPQEENGRVALLVDPPLPDLAEIEAIEDDDKRRASLRILEAASDPESLFSRVLSSSGVLPAQSAQAWNNEKLWAAEQPAANGITNARSLAKMYAACIGSIDGTRLLDDAVVRDAAREQSAGGDRVVPLPLRFGTGFQLPNPILPLLSDSSFGHTGAGGALGFADLDSRVAFGYVQNQLGGDLSGEPRTEALVKAVRSSLA
jgi:CubicO group peptidase (beta-lactamase class C family)